MKRIRQQGLAVDNNDRDVIVLKFVEELTTGEQPIVTLSWISSDAWTAGRVRKDGRVFFPGEKAIQEWRTGLHSFALSFTNAEYGVLLDLTQEEEDLLLLYMLGTEDLAL